MTDTTDPSGLDHTRAGVPEGRLLHASPILPATDPREGGETDYGTADAWDGFEGYIGTKETAQVAAAIRALEAKVREGSDAIFKAGQMFGDVSLLFSEDIESLRADRDRISANYDKLLTEHIRTMDERNEARQERDRLAGEVFGVRLALTNAQQVADELRAELAAAREELSQRREHMRRGIKPGRATGGEA